MRIARLIRVATHIVVTHTVIVVTACAGNTEQKPAGSSAARNTATDMASGTIRSDTIASSGLSGVAPAPHVDSDSAHAGTDPATWTITAGGLGPVRAGMTVAQARAALGGELTVTGSAPACGYAASRHLPAGVNFMITDGKIARVQVLRGSVATAAGARIGDSEQRVRELYAGHVASSPHKYTNGHYLTVTPESTADSSMRIVFETDGSRVTVYRSGMLPQVEWVEGCS